jgi:hypothetical protein
MKPLHLHRVYTISSTTMLFVCVACTLESLMASSHLIIVMQNSCMAATSYSVANNTSSSSYQQHASSSTTTVVVRHRLSARELEGTSRIDIREGEAPIILHNVCAAVDLGVSFNDQQMGHIAQSCRNVEHKGHKVIHGITRRELID